MDLPWLSKNQTKKHRAIARHYKWKQYSYTGIKKTICFIPIIDLWLINGIKHIEWYFETYRFSEDLDFTYHGKSHETTEDYYKNIFIERTTGETEDIFNYHSLFRKFLTEKLFKTKSRNEINSLLLKAYDYYSSKNNKIKAISYLLASEEYEKAIREISGIYEELLKKKWCYYCITNWHQRACILPGFFKFNKLGCKNNNHYHNIYMKMELLN